VAIRSVGHQAGRTYGKDKDALQTAAFLILQDGTCYRGLSFGAQKSMIGEVCSSSLPAFELLFFFLFPVMFAVSCELSSRSDG
jgi:hypothetical protein